jgi:hypothetical protein
VGECFANLAGDFLRDQREDHRSELQLDASAGTQLISVRMSVSMIEDLKLIAQINGLGYQTLMKQVLGRFVECEKKAIWNQIVSKQLKVEPTPQEQRKRAGT